MPDSSTPDEDGLLSKAAPIAAVALPLARTFTRASKIDESGMDMAQRIMAKKLRAGSFMRQVDSGDRFKGRFAKPLNTLAYGTPNVTSKSLDSHSKLPDVVMAPLEEMNGTNIGKTQVLGATPNNAAARGMASNKLTEYKMLQRYAPGSSGRAESLKSYLKGLKGSPEQRLEKLQVLLQRRFGKGFVLKGVDDFHTSGALITERDNFANILRGAKDYKAQDINKLLKLRQTNPNAWANQLQANPSLRKYFAITDMLKNPGNSLVQERIKMKALNPVDRLLEKLINGRNVSTQEYRLHAIGNRVLPITVPRYGPLSQLAASLGFRSKATKDMEAYAQQVLGKLPRKLVGNNSFALDMAHTAMGPKIIETNPGGYSGFLHNARSGVKGAVTTAINNQRMMSALQGQSTLPIRLAKTLGAGGVGLGAYLIAKKLRDRHNGTRTNR